MDSTDAPPQTKKTRLIYDRDAILAVKKNATSSGLDIYDFLSRVNVPGAASQRLAKAKTRTPPTPKTQNDRARDSSNIVLGPQKRTWNTGCHVAHPIGRESSDPYGNNSRGGKGGPDYRYSRGSTDHKRDFRGGHNVSRERGVGRRVDGAPFFYRAPSRDDRHTKEGRNSYQEEPEWFSEGPTTVNDTIELGGIIEEVGIEASAAQPQSTENSVRDTDANASVGDSKLLASTSDTEKKPHVSIQSGTNKESVNPSATTLSHLNLFDALQIPKTSPDQGSRFRHLFTKTDTDTKTMSTTPKGNINEQLLQLLKGSANPGSSVQDQNNVIQVENKLRSILLGQNASRTGEGNRGNANEAKCTKPKVLTVEEIEAQLNCSQDSRPTEVVTQPPTARSVVDPEKSADELLKPFTSNHSMGSNLAPMFQSLAMKQQQQQQQAACAQSVQLRSALNTLGILSNPMARLPTSANAVSASARINQLQQADLSTPPGLNDFTSGQSAFRHLWDGSLAQANSLSSQHSQSITSSLASPSPRPIGAPPGLLADLGSRSAFGPNPAHPSSPNAAVAPRRPIVKMQQSAVANHAYPTLSSMVASNSNSSGILGPNLSDVDRRLLNMALKQQQVNLSGSRGMTDNFSVGSAVHHTSSGDMRQAPPGLSQNTGSPLIHPISNTNNSAFVAHTRSTLQNDNALAFLSQLVERDRAVCPKPHNFGSFMNTGIKAKTLEEIEHQEVASSGSFL